MRKELCEYFDRQLRTCLKNKQPFKEKHVYSDESYGEFSTLGELSLAFSVTLSFWYQRFRMLPSIIFYVFNESLWVTFNCLQQKLKAGKFLCASFEVGSPGTCAVSHGVNKESGVFNLSALCLPEPIAVVLMVLRLLLLFQTLHSCSSQKWEEQRMKGAN